MFKRVQNRLESRRSTTINHHHHHHITHRNTSIHPPPPIPCKVADSRAQENTHARTSTTSWEDLSCLLELKNFPVAMSQRRVHCRQGTKATMIAHGDTRIDEGRFQSCPLLSLPYDCFRPILENLVIYEKIDGKPNYLPLMLLRSVCRKRYPPCLASSPARSHQSERRPKSLANN